MLALHTVISQYPQLFDKLLGLQMGDPKKSADVVPQDLLPTVDDVPFVDDSLFDDQFWEEDSCKLVTFNETFYFTAPVARDATGTYGERYYFDNDLNRTDGTQVDDVKLTGSCTRTRLPGEFGTAGAGVCNFIIYHTLGNWSMSTAGFLETAATSGIGGTLAVTGGTGEMVSVMGEMDVWPMDINGMLATGDVFDTVYGYYINAIYGLLICPKPYHITPVNTTEEATPEGTPVGGPGV